MISTGLERDRAVVPDELGGDHQVVAHELVGVLVVPDPAGLLDDRVLGVDPVGLGVDEGAVHVPEDRQRAGRRDSRRVLSGRSRCDGIADGLRGAGVGGAPDYTQPCGGLRTTDRRLARTGAPAGTAKERW